jgi:AraC-like DNA-binding protein
MAADPEAARVRVPRRRQEAVAEPPLVRGRGYPSERSFSLGRSHLTHQFANIYPHPLVEVGVVAAGKGKLYLDGVSYPLAVGDGYFLDMCHPHRHDPDGFLECEYAHLKYEALEALAPQDERARFLQPFQLLAAGKVCPVIPRARRLRSIIHDATRWYSGADPFGYALAWSRVIEAFVEIGRYCIATQGSTPRPVAPRDREVVTRALHFIHANSATALSLRQVASHCDLSPSRFSAVFSTVMHQSPIAYRNRVRVNRAIAQLSSTGKSVQEIAFECGFHSLAQFRVLLRRQTGGTARALRSRSA